MLDLGPLVAAIVPYLAVAVGAGLALIGVAFGIELARRELLRRRRRPVHPSFKRSMIVVNRSGAAVLHGQELHDGDELQVRLTLRNDMGHRIVEWVTCRLHRNPDGMIVLVLPNKRGVPAAGQLARWPAVKAKSKAR